MSVDHIRYDLLVRDALRGVVRRVISDAAAHGLPGEHHFYISFDTRAPGVRVSPRTRAQYPEDMTIVLQHQFWDLTVTDTAFEVGLSFNGVPERLFIPFDAIKGFFDPSVQFGLELETAGGDAPASEGGTATPANAPQLPAAAPVPKPAVSPAARLVTGTEPPQGKNAGRSADSGPTPAPDGEPDPEPPKPEGGGEVVRLDRFRKK